MYSPPNRMESLKVSQQARVSSASSNSSIAQLPLPPRDSPPEPLTDPPEPGPAEPPLPPEPSKSFKPMRSAQPPAPRATTARAAAGVRKEPPSMATVLAGAFPLIRPGIDRGLFRPIQFMNSSKDSGVSNWVEKYTACALPLGLLLKSSPVMPTRTVPPRAGRPPPSTSYPSEPSPRSGSHESSPSGLTPVQRTSPTRHTRR